MVIFGAIGGLIATSFAPALAQAQPANYSAGAVNAPVLTQPASLSPITDEQLSDCLVKIAEVPYTSEGTGGPSEASIEFSMLKSAFYWEHPDLVGFASIPDPAQVDQPGNVALMQLPVAAEQDQKFQEVAAELVSRLEVTDVKMEPIPAAATVRELCAVFLDAYSGSIGALVTGVAMDQSKNTVVVFADERFDEVAQYVKEVYGSLATTERSGPSVEEARHWTGTPVPGGSRMYLPGGTPWCTTGFAVRNNGTGVRYMTTAHHCGNPGSVFHSAANLGTVVSSLNANGIDVSFMGGSSYSGTIWRGGTTSNSLGHVIGTLSGLPTAGAAVGFSGASTGEHNSPYMYSGCYGGYCSLLFMNTHKTAGGDSGGPWFAYIGGSASVYAVAIHRGGPASFVIATDVRTALYLTNTSIVTG